MEADDCQDDYFAKVLHFNSIPGESPELVAMGLGI